MQELPRCTAASVPQALIAARRQQTRRRVQQRVVVAALLGLTIGGLWLATTYGWRHGMLFLVGAGFGLMLYHARFGFTSAFRGFVLHGDGRGIRAHMLMLALASVLFAPIMAFNETIGGAVAPLSLSVLVGAFLFSIGMQLGGG